MQLPFRKNSFIKVYTRYNRGLKTYLITFGHILHNNSSLARKTYNIYESLYFFYIRQQYRSFVSCFPHLKRNSWRWFFECRVLNSFTMMIRYVLVLIILHGIAFENVCNGRFNWSKYGSDTLREALGELMRDLIREKVSRLRNSRIPEIPNSKKQVAVFDFISVSHFLY